MKFDMIFYNTAELFLKKLIDYINEFNNFKVMSLTALYLDDKYSKFIEDIYKEGWIPEEDLKLKQEFVKENKRTSKAYILEIECKDLTQEYSEKKGKFIYSTIENLKRNIRQKYKLNVPNYFHDILVHAPDDESENQYLINLINSYKENTKNKTKIFVVDKEDEYVR